MPLANPTPFTVDATEAKTFPHRWLYSINVMAPSPTAEARGSIDILPYNGDTGEVLPGQHTTVATDKLFKALAEVPELAAAFDAILAAVAPFEAWVAAQEGSAQ